MSESPKQMLDAMPVGATFLHHKTGSTWNDGGAWHSVFFRKADGSGGVIHMASDYQADLLEVSDWVIPPTPLSAALELPEVRALVDAAIDRLETHPDACDCGACVPLKAALAAINNQEKKL